MTFKLKPNKISVFLNTPIVGPIDRWHVVHLLSGAALALFTKKIYLATGLLVAYELFELLLIDILFKKEDKLNIFLDIVIGLFGFVTARYVLK